MTLYKSPKEIEREQLALDYALLSAQYEAESEAARLTTDPGSRIKHLTTAKKVFEQMEEIDTKLNQQDRQSSDPNQRYLKTIDAVLPKIDFTNAKSAFHKRLADFSRQGGSAVFLVEKCAAMLGDLLLREIRDLLSQNQTDLKHYQIEFTGEISWNQQGVLSRLSGYLREMKDDASTAQQDEHYIEDLNSEISQIQDILAKVFRSNVTIHVEIRGWDMLPDEEQSKVLAWLLEVFWQPLVSQRQIISQEYSHIKCIFTLVSDSELPSSSLNLPFLRSIDNCASIAEPIDAIAITPLPIEHWTIQEIKEWLEDFQGLPISKSQSLAEQLHNSSLGGQPPVVRDLLNKRFRQISIAS